KEPVPLDAVAQRVPRLLEEIHRSMWDKAKAFRDASTHPVSDPASFARILESRRGFLVADWCGDAACEDRVKEETGATIRCIPQGEPAAEGPWVRCGRPGAHRVYFARSY